MLMNNPNVVFGDLVLKCQLGKPFDKLRSIMKKKNIDGLFKKSCFAHFLELSGSRPLHFPMIIVYGLVKRRIMYAGDDGGLKENRNKMDEVWINYCGMPICFGLKDFANVTGLRYDRSEEPDIKKTPHKGSNKCKVKKYRLLGIVGPCYKVKDFIADLKNKDIPKHYREKLCLVWFVHSVLLARDVKKVIEFDLLALADDFERFNDYPWGYDSYYLTVKYLLKKRKPKTITLYSFPRAFMAWACEAIPSLRKYFTNYPDKVVHPWFVPTINELGMTSFLTLGLVDTKEDPTVELIKKELDEATYIRIAVRKGQSNVEALHDLTQTATNLGASSGGVAGGVVYDGGSHPAFASTASHDYKHVGAQKKINMFKNTPCTGPPSHTYTGPFHPYSGPSHPSSPSCSYYKCKVCKNREDKLLDKIEIIVEATKELKSRSGVILSNEGLLKKVDIFMALGKDKKKELEEFIKMKVQKEYTMHSFAAKDFSNMTNMCVWYEDKMQLAYLDAYDAAADRIMDLNLYNNFKDRYADLRNLADSGGLGFDQSVSTFQWDEEAITYVRGERQYPHGKIWTKAKKILAVMNVDVTHILTVEILIYKEKIKVYDCNLSVFSEKTFLTHMQPHLKLLPKLLTQSKLMDHLPTEVLAKKSWVYEDRNKNIQLPKNTTGAVCGPYSLAYMECLLIGTQMTSVCDTVVGKMQWVWAYGVLTKWLDPEYKKEHVQRQRRTR
ncbi:hypothetical protein P3S67_017277 [Capsicum chacoense]